MPEPQAKIRNILCDGEQPCSAPQSELLDRAIARFKTPSLRDLDTLPFMHNGQSDRIEDVLSFIERHPILRGTENCVTARANYGVLHLGPLIFFPSQRFSIRSTRTISRDIMMKPDNTYRSVRLVQSMESSLRSPSLMMVCQRCHEPIGHQNPTLWCIKCRWAQRQRGQARGLENSMQTRRLKAWLRKFPHS